MDLVMLGVLCMLCTTWARGFADEGLANEGGGCRNVAQGVFLGAAFLGAAWDCCE